MFEILVMLDDQNRPPEEDVKRDIFRANLVHRVAQEEWKTVVPKDGGLREFTECQGGGFCAGCGTVFTAA